MSLSVSCDGKVRVRCRRCSRAGVVIALVVAPALLAAGGSAAANAAASTAASVAWAAGGGSVFCQAAAGLHKDTQAFSSGSIAAFRSAAPKFTSTAARMVSVAPAAVKGDLQKVVAATNVLLADLKAVDYNPANLAPAVSTKIANDETAIAPAGNAVDAYVEKACGINLNATGSSSNGSASSPPPHAATAAGRALLRASYQAARHQRSFELSVINPFREIAPGVELGKNIDYTVLQTAATSQAVEQVPFTRSSKGTTRSGFSYDYIDEHRLCVWGSPAATALGLGGTPSCQTSNLQNYDGQVFPYLALTGAHITGTAHLDGTAVTGVGGQLNLTSTGSGSSSGISASASLGMDYGAVTVWVATQSKLPVAITFSSGGTIYAYSDWGKPLRFPPGTP